MKVINNVLGFDGIKIVQDSEGFKFSLDSVGTSPVVVFTKHNGGNITHHQFCPELLPILTFRAS